MNLVTYLNLRVHIVLTNEFYYIGKVIEADEHSLTIIDKRGLKVTLKKEIIASIVELGQ